MECCYIYIGGELYDAVDESKIDLERPECSDYGNLPKAIHCNKGKCKTLCTGMHGKSAWGECLNRKQCQCHWYC